MTSINDAVRTVADQMDGRIPTVQSVMIAIREAARQHYPPHREITACHRIQRHISQHIHDVTPYVDTTGVTGELIPALHQWINHYKPSPAEMRREIYAAAAKIYDLT